MAGTVVPMILRRSPLPARGAGLNPLLRTGRQGLLRQCDGGETTKTVQRKELIYTIEPNPPKDFKEGVPEIFKK